MKGSSSNQESFLQDTKKVKENKVESLIFSLPPEIFLEVCDFLKVEKILELRLVNKTLNELVFLSREVRVEKVGTRQVTVSQLSKRQDY